MWTTSRIPKPAGNLIRATPPTHPQVATGEGQGRGFPATAITTCFLGVNCGARKMEKDVLVKMETMDGMEYEKVL